MIKKDIPIIREFLGNENNVLEMITPLKCARIYFKKNSEKEFIIILTPMLQEEKEVLFKSTPYCKDLKPIEHIRGKNFVYTFE